MRHLLCVFIFLASATQAFGNFLYFTDIFSPQIGDGRIQRLRTDGTDLRSLAEINDGLRGIAVDVDTAGLFVTNVDEDRIAYASTGQELRTVVSAGLAFPQDLALAGNQIVWIDTIRNAIQAASKDGANPQTLLADVHGVALAVDSNAQKIFFEHRHSSERGAIRRMNLDGTGVETVIDNVPTASSIAVDSTNGTVFWGSSAGLTGGNGGIYRVNFDGTGFQEIFVKGDNLDTGALAIDQENGLLYFAQDTSVDRNAIMSIRLDGSNPIVLADGFGLIPHMALSSVEIGAFVPEPSGACIAGVWCLLILLTRGSSFQLNR